MAMLQACQLLVAVLVRCVFGWRTGGALGAWLHRSLGANNCDASLLRD
jgi:hypothetical protein